MTKQVTARDAVGLIRSGDTVAIGGVISLVAPEAMLRALGERYRETAEPRDLTIFSPNRPGWTPEPETGVEHLAQPGMVRRVITSTFSRRDSPRFAQMAVSGDFEAYSYPMGCLFRLLRECAAGSPGFLTQVGLNTYADPAAGSAGVNERSGEQPLVRRLEIDGEPYLLYRTLPIDVAIIRGTVADPDGNISLAGEPISAGAKHLAMAAHNNGGKVIAQVKRMAERGFLHPRMVEVPGILVDAVVVEPDSWQSQIGEYEPALVGELRTPDVPVPPLPFGHQKVIMRRVAMEMEQGDVVNLGVGIGTQIPALALEEGFLDHVTFSIEHGAIGGVPAMGTPASSGAFGAHYNPAAILDTADVFDFYHGGGIDLTCLGFAQVNAEGSVNVGWFAGNLRGPGGLVDITHRTRKIVFCGTLTSGGVEVDVTAAEDGDGAPTVRIAREGRNRKFVSTLEQVNFHGPSAVAKGQHVLVVTERAVFRVTATGLELIEIAPGIDLERHVRAVVDFEFSVASDLRVMDARLFSRGPIGLRPAPKAAARR